MSYQPPPEGSSSTPPEGGYSPPPPPAGGGYSPPPMTSMTPGGGDPSNMAHLPQSYMNAVTKPSVGTFEAEIPNASPIKTLVGVTIVAVISFIFSLLFAGAAMSQLGPLMSQISPGSNIDTTALAGGTGIGSALIGLIFTYVFFYIGAGIQYLVAKMLGGQGQGFGTHAYLDSLSYTPIKVVSTIVQIIPVIGSLVALVLTLYQLYLQGLGLQASQRLPAGKAMLAAFTPLIVTLVLGCLGVLVCGTILAGMLNSLNTR